MVKMTNLNFSQGSFADLLYSKIWMILNEQKLWIINFFLLL